MPEEPIDKLNYFLLTEKDLVLFLLLIVNDLETVRHILIKKLPMLNLSMFFKTFKRPYKQVFYDGSHIRVPVSIDPVHQLNVVGHNINFRFLKHVLQIIDSGLDNARKVFLNRQLCDLTSEWRIEKF